MDTPSHYYRYDDVCYADYVDEDGFASGETHIKVVLREYRVVKVTPKGVWLSNDRFVLNDARKRYAYPTKELALQSFMVRKRRQRMHLRHQLDNTETAILLGEHMAKHGLRERITEFDIAGALLGAA